MKNSVSEQNFYIESEEEDEEKEFNRDGEGEADVNGTDSDESLADDNRQQSKTGSYNTSWPQSYRQSIDLYSSVPSPNLTFLGTPTLSRLSSSYLSSSLTRRHTPESLPTVVKPLLDKPEDEQLPPQRRSSRSLLPPTLLRRSSSIRKDEKLSRVSHELPMSRQSSFGQAVLNGLNVLCGVGILSTPYAAKEGGWLGLSILLIFAVLSFYTGMLLRYCLDSEPGLGTYPDIGQAAFGTAGRVVISIILYVELYACCVEYIILESDNLSSLFPNANISLGGFELDSPHFFALMTTLAVLPTVWLRDLSVLSYISAGGVIASVLVVLCLFWIGLVDNVGIHSEGTVLNLGTLPVAIGLYGYCYSGHAVFPNIYTSMAQPSRFPAVLLACFGICTLLYAGVAYMGYTMFGEKTESQFTLNLPQDLVASKVAVWTTVVNPFTKYALTMSPVAMSLEELIPSNHMKSHMYAICIRTALVISTLLVALSIPFFGLVMSLIGSLLTMLVTLILPCACFLSILRAKATRFQIAVCIIIIAVGVVSSVFGTRSSLSQIIENLNT
ncbi:PREDICTED: vacuolar amino acid transporter 1-like [Populus euphratica]|uniref:Vacuolar amino acid transporter 1-like n=1 Tax=Populus euphratica TaxID=75702 RepID=A0AAJ6Y3S6_POPEU|nr:PREDICTED: vacuolar amino acid transporter 1-like [Populus euphratica]XP_011041045.1 PREDICTED: vacuolar amino acid transporter 1-like [Populus euphratica]XP_011041047.1 PREDICTED: vacuolar amino acid transporter 1-like [Populus euphratica]XP_011041048.1 PREDICTED: vacuolar amino acid transporter 1-like [Populus euphratica]XP_011041049.1 PREDICTED: vacuolar amino acid transporter 1-like [Populus euphratica]XP_011041050.1 PREDICTED: vacuolar amino acid transporter 1-like [Populus euphratica]